jgi:hypothetical protein
LMRAGMALETGGGELKAASAPPVPLTGKRKKQHPGAAESDSENTDASDSE